VKTPFLFTPARKKLKFKKTIKMETLEQIKVLTETLSVDVTKFYAGNKSAGTRARKGAQELKALLQKLRGEILENRKTTENA